MYVSYHSGAIFKKIAKFKHDTKKYQTNHEQFSPNPLKNHSKTVSKTVSKKVSKNDAKMVENGSPQGSQNASKISKDLKNKKKIDVKNVLFFNIDFLRFRPRFWSLLGLQLGAKSAALLAAPGVLDPAAF